MESFTPGVTGYDLCGQVSPECVDATHHFEFYLDITSFYL